MGHFKVHRVMGRGYLNRPGAEGWVNSFISNDRYPPIHRRQDNLFAKHILEPLIFGINGNSSIAEYGFRSGGSHRNKILVTFVQRIAYVIQVALNISVVNFKVTVELMDADELVRPGMTAAVSIVVSELENVLLVPNRAVRVDDGMRVVYIMNAGEMEMVEVVLGSSADLYSEVIGGDLQAGDTVILNPPLMMFDTDGPPSFMR